jgi:hypothetical protein
MGAYTALLVAGYCGVLCAALTQIAQTVRSRMSKKTYHFSMLAGVSAQSVVRILLWSVLSSPKRWDPTVSAPVVVCDSVGRLNWVRASCR